MDAACDDSGPRPARRGATASQLFGPFPADHRRQAGCPADTQLHARRGREQSLVFLSAIEPGRIDALLRLRPEEPLQQLSSRPGHLREPVESRRAGLGPMDASKRPHRWRRESRSPARRRAALHQYSIDDSFQVHAQVWIQKRPGSAGQALTAPELGCGQPAVSPDEKMLAMVCSKGSNQSVELDVASLDATSLTLGSPATLVSGQLLASPAFSPDGKTIAYLAPSRPGGNFQLWTVGSSGPASVRNITTDLGLDSTSAPVWIGG